MSVQGFTPPGLANTPTASTLTSSATPVQPATKQHKAEAATFLRDSASPEQLEQEAKLRELLAPSPRQEEATGPKDGKPGHRDSEEEEEGFWAQQRFKTGVAGATPHSPCIDLSAARAEATEVAKEEDDEVAK